MNTQHDPSVLRFRDSMDFIRRRLIWVVEGAVHTVVEEQVPIEILQSVVPRHDSSRRTFAVRNVADSAVVVELPAAESALDAVAANTPAR